MALLLTHTSFLFFRHYLCFAFLRQSTVRICTRNTAHAVAVARNRLLVETKWAARLRLFSAVITVFHFEVLGLEGETGGP